MDADSKLLPGTKVILTDTDAVNTHGRGPFTVVRVNPTTGSVELEELGNVSLSEVSPFVGQSLEEVHPLKRYASGMDILLDEIKEEGQCQSEEKDLSAPPPKKSQGAVLTQIERLAASIVADIRASEEERLIARQLLRVLFRD